MNTPELNALVSAWGPCVEDLVTLLKAWNSDYVLAGRKPSDSDGNLGTKFLQYAERHDLLAVGSWGRHPDGQVNGAHRAAGLNDRGRALLAYLGG